MSEDSETHMEEESALDPPGAPTAINDDGRPTVLDSRESSPGSLDRGTARRQCSAFFSMPLTQERSTHLLSVIRATMGEEGVGEATSSGLDWAAGLGVTSVSLQNEGSGTRAQVTAGRAFGWALAGSLGVVSGSVMAGLLEPITFGVFLGSAAGGIVVALGAGTVYARGAKKRVARLMDRIHNTMERMGAWPEVAAEAEGDAVERDELRRRMAESARNIERLEALQDRRDALGGRVTLRRLTYATAVGASLVSILPIALRFFPTDYPLPWIVVGVLGWIFTRTVRRLFRGIRETKELDREIEARLGSTDGPVGELTTDVGPS